MLLRIAGGTVLYKTKYQDTIATSSTEAEFTAACKAGKSILYVRSILDEIGLSQDEATPLFIDNNGALMMGNAQQPTRRTSKAYGHKEVSASRLGAKRPHYSKENH